jgi:hypothetical protein
MCFVYRLVGMHIRKADLIHRDHKPPGVRLVHTPVGMVSPGIERGFKWNHFIEMKPAFFFAGKGKPVVKTGFQAFDKILCGKMTSSAVLDCNRIEQSQGVENRNKIRLYPYSP